MRGHGPAARPDVVHPSIARRAAKCRVDAHSDQRLLGIITNRDLRFVPVADWGNTKVDEVMTALYDIHDPEIGMSIVDLDLIKHVEIGADGTPTDIKMVLTTPFCPWAGELIQTIKTKTEEVVGPPVKVTLLADRWEPPPGLF